MYSDAYTYAQVRNTRPFNSQGIKHTHFHEHYLPTMVNTNSNKTTSSSVWQNLTDLAPNEENK